MNYPLKHKTSFTLMPGDANYMGIIFGGYFMSQMDLACAELVRMILHSSQCDLAVTYKANFEFLKPTLVGDITILEVEVTEVKDNAIVLEVNAFRIPLPTLQVANFEDLKEHSAIGNFVFVTKQGENFRPHRLEKYKK